MPWVSLATEAFLLKWKQYLDRATPGPFGTFQLYEEVASPLLIPLSETMASEEVSPPQAQWPLGKPIAIILQMAHQ